MSERRLVATKLFMTKELTSFMDEIFILLYRDISNFSQYISNSVFRQSDRRISIYGVRGLGKTTAMQGALLIGLREKKDNHVPINVVVPDVRGVRNTRDLSDLFYRSVILGVNRVAKYSRRKADLRKVAGRYAPWIAKKITEAIGIIFGPVALASDLSEMGVKWLVERLGYTNIDSLIASKNLDPLQAATLLLDKLEDTNGKPIFVIDELDKVEDDTVLSDFFDGNHSWFQGRQGIISLSYTFGESLRKTLVTSASRISSIEGFPGITSLNDAIEIIRSRAELGLSQIEKNENAVRNSAEAIIPNETIKAILNVSAPNTYLMLERTSQAIDRAIITKSGIVSPDQVYTEPIEDARPTKLETSILSELASSRLSPSVVSDRLQKDRGLITRTLQKMVVRDWVGRIGAGKRAYYYITAKGEAALQRR